MEMLAKFYPRGNQPKIPREGEAQINLGSQGKPLLSSAKGTQGSP